MNIICGIIEQTSGEILIYNRDIEYYRQLISYCPQRMFFIRIKILNLIVCFS